MYKSQKKSLIWHHLFYKRADRLCRPYGLKHTIVPKKAATDNTNSKIFFTKTEIVC